MPLTLERADLPALVLGFALLGSGGGGPPHVVALMLQNAAWPLTVARVAEVDRSTPCVAVAYIGSTLILKERLPGLAPFTAAINAIERWLGAGGAAVCTLEGAGVNGLAALQLAGHRQVLDADCMGRALPDLDQITLLVDRLPGLVAAAPTGDGGVTLVHDAAPRDIERVLRTALECNGGWAAMALGGFSVGDLYEHAIPDSMTRALQLGRSMRQAMTGEPETLTRSVGGTLLGAGRVVGLCHEPDAAGVVTYELRTERGDVVRLVSRSEHIGVLRNGAVVASSPTIIVALDATTRAPLEVDEVAIGKDLVLFALPAPRWWAADARRLSEARPSRWGLEGLDGVP